MFNTNTMSFHKDTEGRNKLLTEASTMGYDRMSGAQYIRVKSHHTGREVVFLLGKVSRDTDGDVMAWDYYPMGNDVNVCKLVIFND